MYSVTGSRVKSGSGLDGCKMMQEYWGQHWVANGREG